VCQRWKAATVAADVTIATEPDVGLEGVDSGATGDGPGVAGAADAFVAARRHRRR
jgi:hypothetical protein